MRKKVGLIISAIIVVLLIIFIFNNIKVEEKSVDKKIFYGVKGETDIDTIWCGTFQLAWNELKNYIGSDIEFNNGNSYLLQNLNQSKFYKEEIDKDDYYIKVSKIEPNLKKQIYKDLSKKFGIKESNLVECIDESASNGICIYSLLKKEFSFLEKFDNLNLHEFADINGDKSRVKFFGIGEESNEELTKNVEILYYENYYSFILKLKTKENEEVILYKTKDLENMSFEKLYDNVVDFSDNYSGKKELLEDDILLIPYINLKFAVNYTDLCNKEIKNTDGEFISSAMQDIDFALSAVGGKVFSEAIVTTDSLSAPPSTAEYYEFNSPFVLFLKEADKGKPYFAVKILNSTFLEKDRY